MTRRLFVIDDNVDYQFIFFKLLKEMNRPYSVKFFENAKACHQHMLSLQLVNAIDRPSLILTDLHMPGMNGLQLLKLIRHDDIQRDNFFQDVALVVMSSYLSEGQIVQCYQAGADAVILKPYDFVQLKQTVESICNFWLEREV